MLFIGEIFKDRKTSCFVSIDHIADRIDDSSHGCQAYRVINQRYVVSWGRYGEHEMKDFPLEQYDEAKDFALEKRKILIRDMMRLEGNCDD